MQQHPIFISLAIILGILALARLLFFPQIPWPEIFRIYAILVVMLKQVIDSTNLAGRRIAWAIGLAILFAAVPLLAGVEGGADTIALLGGVSLALSTYDFLLLRQILVRPSQPLTAPMLRHG